MVYVLAALGFLSAFSLTLALLLPSRGEALLRARLEPPRTEERTAGPSPLARGFRLLAERFQTFILRLTPKRSLRRWRERLKEAGNPLTPGSLLAIRFYLACLGGLLLFLLKHSLLLALLAAFLFSRLPSFWLERRASLRRKKMQAGLPQVLDLLCVAVEAGMGLEGAVRKVAETLPGPLGEELRTYLQEVAVGLPREEAWRNLARRSRLPEVESVVAAILQAERFGSSISQTLRLQSSLLRQKMRYKEEEKARQLPVKLVFPLVFFILPTVFLVLLGPAIIQVMETFMNR
mgnify:CR=1 FL=1